MLPAAASNDFVALSAGDDAWSTDGGAALLRSFQSSFDPVGPEILTKICYFATLSQEERWF